MQAADAAACWRCPFLMSTARSVATKIRLLRQSAQSSPVCSPSHLARSGPYLQARAEARGHVGVIGCTASSMRAAGRALLVGPWCCSLLAAHHSTPAGAGLATALEVCVWRTRGVRNTVGALVQGKYQRRAGADAVSSRLQDCSCPLQTAMIRKWAPLSCCVGAL